MDQSTAPRRHESLAPVISMEDRRKARVRTQRRSISMRPVVALWFGAAIFAVATLLGTAAMIALRSPAIGIPAGLLITTLASWPAAGAWQASRRSDAPRTDRASA